MFTKNRERLINGEASRQLLPAVVEEAGALQLLSEEHFTVDGTLIQAWANRRSFHEKLEPPERGTGARGRKLLRDTHESITDPESAAVSQERVGGHGCELSGPRDYGERNGLVITAMATEAGNAGERQAALEMVKRLQRERLKHHRRMTLGDDKNYEQKPFIGALRSLEVAQHIAEYAPNPKWPNWLTGSERSDPGAALSPKKRKLVEKVFGWMKHDRLRQIKLRGLRRVDWLFQLAAAAHNLLHMGKLIPIQAKA